MTKALLLITSHLLAAAAGFALGIYVLPILTAPAPPPAAEVAALAENAVYKAEFRRELKDSDLLHWGEGIVYLSPQAIGLEGRLAPGPDYKLYLVPSYVETEAEFMRVKAQSLRVGDVKTFENFVVAVPPATDLARYNTVVVWCESFEQFITAAKYR